MDYGLCYRSAMHLHIETELEDDGRWLAEIPQLPGVLAYGATAEEASTKVEFSRFVCSLNGLTAQGL